MVGAGDLGRDDFGGWPCGFEVDLEVFFVNAWLNFHKSHYLWSADAEEVTAERGLHYAAQAGLKLMFMLPREVRTRPEKQRRGE